ncbi:MAG TPA: TonB-dependent receptor, partial [Gammaproteobacteria bacterium]|nr:TonB-dependent receptor [Gammaproteobacteria bacterium]
GEPSYRDAFVHLGTKLGTKHTLGFNSIGFDDDIELTPENDSDLRERARSDTDSRQVWLKLQSDWSADLSSRSLVYSTHFKSERRGTVDHLDQIAGRVDDTRDLTATGIKQDWQWDASERQWLTWGFQAEQLSGEYAYSSAVDVRGVLAALTAAPVSARDSSLAPDGGSYSAYFSDRLRLTDRLIADFGLRWDKQTYLPPAANDQLSPRSSLLYRLGPRTDLRFSFGRFFQSEGLLDLQVEDGVLDFSAAQDASHSITGIEHRFDNELALRVEVFRKWTRRARARYENLFDPMVLLPELRTGRVRISPDRAEARGLEVFLNGEQRIPRSWDQRHAISGGLTWAAGLWTLSAAATYHTGWPATALSLQTVVDVNCDTQLVAVAGDRNGERLDVLRRIDFRASKSFPMGIGSLKFFAEATNVTDRGNPCCLSYEPVASGAGTVSLNRIERDGLPLTINVGALWEF